MQSSELQQDAVSQSKAMKLTAGLSGPDKHIVVNFMLHPSGHPGSKTHVVGENVQTPKG